MQSKTLRLLPLMTVLVGCAAPISTNVRVTDPAPEELRVNEIAVLPVTVDPGLEAFGRDAGEQMYAAVVDQYPQVRVVAPALSLERLQNADQAGAYAQLIADYEQSGTLDATVVRGLSDAVGSAYLLTLRLTYGEESGYGSGQFTGDVRYHGQGLRAIVQLLDGGRGTLLWRSVGDASVVSSDLMRDRNPLDMLAEVMPEIAAKLPVRGGEPLAEATPRWKGPSDRNVFFGASGALLLAFLLL